MVPASFLPSQYGSILIVNDDFNASSGEQITVNRGDKVSIKQTRRLIVSDKENMHVLRFTPLFFYEKIENSS